MFKVLRNERGMVLAWILVMLVVLVIFGTSALVISSFDFEHSVYDEEQTQAYYYARSAITITLESIEKKIDELAVAEAVIQTRIDEYNAAVATENAQQLEGRITKINTAKDNYIAQLNTFYQDVIPNTQDGIMVHDVLGVMDDGTAIDVSVVAKEVTADDITLMLSADSSVGSMSGFASLKVKIDKSNIDRIYSVSEGPTTSPPNIFDYGLYAYGTLYASNGVYMYNTTANAGVDITIDGEYKEDGVNKNEDLIENVIAPEVPPVSLIPGGQATLDTLPVYNAEMPSSGTLTPSSNGYYLGSDPEDGYTGSTFKDDVHFTVDLSDGDVIIVIESLYTTGEFYVTLKDDNNTNNMFYLYIVPNPSELSENSHDFLMSTGKFFIRVNNTIKNNNEGKRQPRAYILIDQNIQNSGSQAEEKDGTYYGVVFNGELILDGFLYSPKNKILLNNSNSTHSNPAIVGSIYGQDVYLPNSYHVKHMPPSGSGTGSSGSGTGTITTNYTISSELPVITGDGLWIRD